MTVCGIEVELLCDVTQASPGAGDDAAAIAARSLFNNWTQDDVAVVRGAVRRVELRYGGRCVARRPLGWRWGLYVWAGTNRCSTASL